MCEKIGRLEIATSILARVECGVTSQHRVECGGWECQLEPVLLS